MSNEAVLVLGSAGFIGSAIVNRLVDLQYRVYAIGHTEATEQEGQLVRIQGSIEDSRLVKEALARCRYVIYAASRTTPGTSAREPELEVISNLLPLSRLLESIAESPG